MASRRGELPASLALLAAGAAATVAAFILRTGADAFAGLLPRIAGLLLWLLLPYLLLAVNTFVVHRFLPPARKGKTLVAGSLTFLASGILIYGRAFLAASGSAMDAHLVFIFGPLYHFVAAALVTVGYLAGGFWAAVNRREGRPGE